jgi:FkbM family methyltransferase
MQLQIIYYKILKSFRINFLILTSRILEYFLITAKSTDKFGTLYDEEFDFYKRYYRNRNTDLIVLDIGANTGKWAKKALEIGIKYNTYVYCVEPYGNQELHRFGKSSKFIQVYDLAISQKKSTNLYFTKNGSGGSAFNPSLQDSNKLRIKRVKSMTGDSFIKSTLITPDLIKIDVDGMDLEVIKTFRNYIKSKHPLIQFEFTKRFADVAGYTLRENIDYLKSLNYEIFVIDKYSKLKRVRIFRLEVIGIQTKNFIALPRTV